MAERPLRFTAHARTVMEERGIAEIWVESAMADPLLVEPDPTQPGALRAFAAVPAYGNRVLRVVYYDEPDARRIITVFFDRGARNKGLTK